MKTLSSHRVWSTRTAVALLGLLISTSCGRDQAPPTAPTLESALFSSRRAHTVTLVTAPAGALPGVAFITQPAVNVTPAALGSESITAALSETSVVLMGTTTVQSVGGVAQFTNLGIATAGTYTLVFSAPHATSLRVSIVVPNVLTVTTTGDGTGTVAVSPTPLGSCGLGCYTYESDQTVTLTATAAAGSIFTGWSGCRVGNNGNGNGNSNSNGNGHGHGHGNGNGNGNNNQGNSCHVKMRTAKTVTATFKQLFNLTVTKAGDATGTVTASPAVSSCGAGCYTYISGTSATLIATALTGTFAGWSGDCTVILANTCTVAMTAAKSVTATFSRPAATITLGNLSAIYDGTPKNATATTSPLGLTVVSITYNGLATPPTTAGSYAVVATLTNPTYVAPPATGTLVIAQASATILLGNLSQTYDGTPKSATASTTPAGLTVVSFTYDGSPTAPTNAGSYAVVATLNNANYQGSATGTLVIAKATAMISLSNLTATYDVNPHSATASTTPALLTGVSITYNGLPTPPTNAGSYAVVASLDNLNYVAVNATGTLVINKATATIALSNLTAIFDGASHNATASTTPAGLTGVSITYNGLPTPPTNAGIYAVVASLDNPNYVAVNATGTMVILTTLRVSIVGSGSVTMTPLAGSPITCISTCSAQFNKDEQVTLHASAAPGSTFSSFVGDCNVQDCTVFMGGDRSVTATFAAAPPTFVISVSANPLLGGSVSGGGTYNSSSQVTVTASPANGYSFSNWTENGVVVSTNATYQFPAANNRTLVANFTVVAPTYVIAVSANPPNGGSVSGAGTYDANSQVTVAASPANGYSFSNWTANGSVVSSNASYQFAATSNRTLVANFAVITTTTYVISLSANPSSGGTVSGGGTVNANSTVAVTANANSGYIFSNWTENGVVVSNNATYQFMATSDRTLVANFVVASYTLTVNVVANANFGSVSSTPDGIGCDVNGDVSPGKCTAQFLSGDVILTATSDNWTYADWSVDGGTPTTIIFDQIQGTSSFTINMTTAHHVTVTLRN
jgi:hypothetical protein